VQPVSAIAAKRVIGVPRDRVFEFLADLDNHWLLADRFIEVVELNGGSGGRVRLQGPLGLRRTAATRVDEMSRPAYVRGSASIGRGTSGHVRWTLDDHRDGTLVELEVSPDRMGPLDSLLLRAGGRRWLAGVFDRILVRLEERLA
jgi:uncharacterized protein YndB with AHSA1/START domain